MSLKEIIKKLKEGETEYLKTKTFSKLPGIYAFFYIGNEFPLLEDSVSKHQIIYIGKTESSQEKRDANTHFKTGKTGSSTVRKSIGSILYTKENLKPIPRNNNDYPKGRFSHFKFDDSSEIKITNWMENNLALSFYEYPQTKQEIEDLESEIIDELVPILNISKNPKSGFKDTLEQLRKNCATIAINNSNFTNQNLEKNKINKPKNTSKNSTSSDFGTIYIDNITESDVKKGSIRIKVENKHIFPEEKSGIPISHSLNFSAEVNDFVAIYTIGSKDGKSRSGVLKLGSSIDQNTFKIEDGTNLKISKTSKNKYLIEKL